MNYFDFRGYTWLAISVFLFAVVLTAFRAEGATYPYPRFLCVNETRAAAGMDLISAGNIAEAVVILQTACVTRDAVKPTAWAHLKIVGVTHTVMSRDNVPVHLIQYALPDGNLIYGIAREDETITIGEGGDL